MTKKHKGNKDGHSKPEKQFTPVTVVVSSAVLGLIGYLAGEIFLDPRPHPVHWLGALAGIVIGYLVGWRMYKRYGDIFGF